MYVPIYYGGYPAGWYKVSGGYYYPYFGPLYGAPWFYPYYAASYHYQPYCLPYYQFYCLPY